MPSTVTFWGTQEVSAMVETSSVLVPTVSVPQAARTVVPARAAAAYLAYVVRFMAL